MISTVEDQIRLVLKASQMCANPDVSLDQMEHEFLFDAMSLWASRYSQSPLSGDIVDLTIARIAPILMNADTAIRSGQREHLCAALAHAATLIRSATRAETSRNSCGDHVAITGDIDASTAKELLDEWSKLYPPPRNPPFNLSLTALQRLWILTIGGSENSTNSVQRPMDIEASRRDISRQTKDLLNNWLKQAKLP